MRVLVLNSAQSRNPRGRQPWISATLSAVDQLSSASFVCSTGMLSWDLGLWAAGRTQSHLHVILPAKARETAEDLGRSLCDNYDIKPDCLQLELLNSARSTERCKDVWLLRDEIACQRADLIYPICIRSGGKLEALLRKPEFAVKVRTDFQKNYEEQPRVLPKWESLNRNELTLRELGDNYVFHLTRSCDGPWPGEKAADYFRAIVDSTERYPRDGFSTLQRIVESRLLRASIQKIRAGKRAVCFTGLEAQKLLELVKWRARYARYSFEPYAVGIRKKAAIELGVRPVVYDSGADNSEASVYRQGQGDGGHWTRECEWRFAGDLDLSRVAERDLVVLTASAAEKEILEAKSRISVASFGFELRGGD